MFYDRPLDAQSGKALHLLKGEKGDIKSKIIFPSWAIGLRRDYFELLLHFYEFRQKSVEYGMIFKFLAKKIKNNLDYW